MSSLAQPEEEEREQRVFKDVSTNLFHSLEDGAPVPGAKAVWVAAEREKAAHRHPGNTADMTAECGLCLHHPCYKYLP